MDIWRPPTGVPHQLDWWRPLIEFGAALRRQKRYWLVFVDEWSLMGRVLRKDRPDVWIYRLDVTGGELLVDGTGQPYRFIPTPASRTSAGQLRRCGIEAAVFGARMHEGVEPVWFESPPPSQWDYQPDRMMDEDPEPSPPPPLRRRGHLTMLEGGFSDAG